MKMRKTTAVVMSVTVMATGALFTSAFAHHSLAMFDFTEQVTLAGTVSSYQWSNPHAYIQMTVPDKDGSVEWSVEAGVPSAISKLGWSRSTLKRGDKVTIVATPARDGSHAGALVSATFPNGTVMKGFAHPSLRIGLPPE